MNKASAKEPSMDEILSSIRQIIADDDAGIGGAKPVAPPAAAAEPEPAEEEALPLSAEQIVEDEPVEVTVAEDSKVIETETSFDEDDDFKVADLVEPDDISFGDSDEPEPAAMVEEPVMEKPKARPAPEPAMPDSTLSEDIADKLLEPATGEAVKATFSRLSHMSVGTSNLTIENMIREMLRPMLKDWLDENLPSVVEKLVEKEIERVSRGG